MPTTFATEQEYCATLDAIMSGSAAVLNELAGRFAVLRRFAGLLELGGLTIPLPDPSNLIPVGLIDFNKYQELVIACPGLMPPYTGQTLTDLKNTVQDAYLGLLNEALSHPFDRMARLQAEIDGALADAAESLSRAVSPAMNALACVRSLCGAAAAVAAGGVGVLFNEEAIETARTAFNEGVTLNPNVLTAAQQASADLVLGVEANLEALLAPPSMSAA